MIVGGVALLATWFGVRPLHVRAAAIEQALLEAACEDVSRWFRPDADTLGLMHRIRTAARVLEGDWPATHEEAIKAWARELVVGRRSLDELARADLRGLLQGKLGWERQKLLDDQLLLRIGKRDRCR